MSQAFHSSSFKVFRETLEKGGLIKGINVKGGDSFSEKSSTI